MVCNVHLTRPGEPSSANRKLDQPIGSSDGASRLPMTPGTYRSFTAPISFETVPLDDSSDSNSIRDDIRSKRSALPTAWGSRIPSVRPKGAGAIGRPVSSLGLAGLVSDHAVKSERGEGLPKRKSAIWDDRGAGSTIPLPAGTSIAKPVMRHQRSVSAFAGLSIRKPQENISSTVESKPGESAGLSSRVPTGMTLRPRTVKPVETKPISKPVVSQQSRRAEITSKRQSVSGEAVALDTAAKAASSVLRDRGSALSRTRAASVQVPTSSSRTTRASAKLPKVEGEEQPSDMGASVKEGVALNQSVGLSTANKRRSMMPLMAPDIGLASIESQSQEMLAETSKEVEQNRQSALDRLSGGQKVEEAKAADRTLSLNSSTSGLNGATPSKPIGGVPRRIGTPARPVAKNIETPSSTTRISAVAARGTQRLVKAAAPSRLDSPRKGVPLASTLRSATVSQDKSDVRVKPNTSNGSSTIPSVHPDRRQTTSAGTREASALTRRTLRIEQGEPASLITPPSTASTATFSPTKPIKADLTPSQRNPITRLRGSPQTSESRSRKLSNNSDIDFRLEQSRRTWLGGLGKSEAGGDGDSPLTGKISNLKLDSSSPPSSRVRKTTSRSSRLGQDGDVFGKALTTRETKMQERIRLLEKRLEAIEITAEVKKQKDSEEAQRRIDRAAVVSAFTELIEECRRELDVLVERRQARQELVDAQERAMDVAMLSM
jgi:hypothetical protein